MKGWLSLYTYIKMLNCIDTPFKMEDEWRCHVAASDISVKTATIIVHDRKLKNLANT